MSKKTHPSFTPEELDSLLARHVLELSLPKGGRKMARLVAWGLLYTVGDAVRIDRTSLPNYRQMGRKTVEEIDSALKAAGLKPGADYQVGPFEAKARASFSLMPELGLPEEVLMRLLSKGFYAPDSLIDPNKRDAVTWCLVHGLPKGDRYLSHDTPRGQSVLKTGDERYKDLLVRVRLLKKR